MLKSIKLVPVLLGLMVIISLVLCKYFNAGGIFLLIIILISIVYQVDTNYKSKQIYHVEETLINVSKFIIISGIPGYIIVKIISLFLGGFD
jgi:predicted nucleic-acid-binding protein